MRQDELMVHIRSGGRRIALYAELGGYFSPDGHLNEPAFRRFVGASLRERLGDAADEAAHTAAREWLSSYLDQVLGYLEERGLGQAMLKLFEVAVDESGRMGVDKVAIDTQRMGRMLTLAAVAKEVEPARKQSADAKREAIFAAALEVFTEHGFHESTMDEIAAKADVAKGTLYRYFKSKEDLLDQLLRATSDRIAARFAMAFSGQSDVLDQIQLFVEEWIAFIEENHALYRLIQAEGLMPRSKMQVVFYEYLISNFPMVKERIVAMNTGGLLKTTSFHTVAYGMLGFIDGVVHKWFRSGMDYPLRDELPIILEVLFNGFMGKRDPGKVFYVPPEER